MRKLAGASISAPDFAAGWLAARRRALDEGDRLRSDFERILTDVFYLLDEYVIDPLLRDSGDMTDEDLTGRIQRELHELDSL